MERSTLSTRRSFSIPQEWRDKLQIFGEASRFTLKVRPQIVSCSSRRVA